jgi:hypothetical protein
MDKLNIQTKQVEGQHGTYTEFIVADECAKCGGGCCKQGYEPDRVYQQRYTEIGIAPANPKQAELKDKIREAHGIEYRNLLDEARTLGFNLHQCRFLSDTGCVIPREERTEICRTYLCHPLWTKRAEEMRRQERNEYQREYRKRKKQLVGVSA